MFLRDTPDSISECRSILSDSFDTRGSLAQIEEAGISDQVWTVEEIVTLLDKGDIIAA
jgi:hypothetical protein